jgi:DNA repair protein RadC
MSNSCVAKRRTIRNGDRLIKKAIALLESRLSKPGTSLAVPPDASDYLRLKMSGELREVFVVLFLNACHQLIACEQLFQGTLTSTSVYPRVVVQRALHHNALSVIFAHNHPSGVTIPSQSDILLTTNLKNALALVEIRVLDHFIIAKGEPYSFSNAGLL